MRNLVLFLLGTIPLAAQSGAYHFVQISVRGAGAAQSVANGGGTLVVSGTQAIFAGQAGVGAAGSLPMNINGTLQGGLITNSLSSGQNLDLRTNADESVLIGSSATPGSKGDSFDLLVAVRRGTTTVAPVGAYSAAYFALNGAKAAGTVSAFMNFTSSAGAWNNVVLGGHTAARDDVNREEQPAGVKYFLGDGGTGVVQFPLGSDYISGDRDLMVSADGAWLLGYSRVTRDIFIGLRRDGDRSGASLDGLYAIGELGAEEPFAVAFGSDGAAQVRWSAAFGSLRADGNGRAEIAEQIVRQRVGAAPGTGTNTSANFWLNTVNGYYSESNGRGALMPVLTADHRRNSFALSAENFIGAQVGAPGEVTLEHGILVGTRLNSALPGTVALAQMGVFNGATFAVGPASPLGYVTLFGKGLAPSTATAASYPFPTTLAGTRVLVNGEPAPLQLVSPGQINVHWPASTASAPIGASATVQVSAAAGLSNTLTVPVAASSPGVFSGAVLHANFAPVTVSAPARPGETLIIFATGMGPVNPPLAAGFAAGFSPLSRTADATLKVYVAGTPAIVDFSGLAGGFAGLYQINVHVPDDALTSAAAPITISLADSFTDLAEIAITR